MPKFTRHELCVIIEYIKYNQLFYSKQIIIIHKFFVEKISNFIRWKIKVMTAIYLNLWNKIYIVQLYASHYPFAISASSRTIPYYYYEMVEICVIEMEN